MSKTGPASVPDDLALIRMGPDLLVTLHGDLEDRTIESIERKVSHEVAQTHARGVLIDVSGLAVVDSFTAKILARLVSMVRLLGAEVSIVGIRPPVAITLVELGMPLAHVQTALNAEQGLARLRRSRDVGVAVGDDRHD